MVDFIGRKIFGKITVENTKPSDTKLRVVAWDADIDEDDHMGTSIVADDGSYEIEYKDKKWDWSPSKTVANWRPDIYVVVEWFDQINSFWRPLTRSKVYSNADTRENREINLSVTLPNTNERTIFGKVTDMKGRPLKGYTVTAWDEDPYSEQVMGDESDDSSRKIGLKEAFEFMGSATTDENGMYRINYAGTWWDQTPHWSVRAGEGAWWRPDIFIKVHKREGSGVLYRSPTHRDIFQLKGVQIDAKIDEA